MIGRIMIPKEARIVNTLTVCVISPCICDVLAICVLDLVGQLDGSA